MDGPSIAGALRSAADQVVPELGRPRTADERTLYHEGRLDAVIRHRQQFLAIAAELEGAGNNSSPSPPSWRVMALSDLKNAYNADTIDDTTFENIRRALEALPDDQH
jgi:hypothetical protein